MTIIMRTCRRCGRHYSVADNTKDFAYYITVDDRNYEGKGYKGRYFHSAISVSDICPQCYKDFKRFMGNENVENLIVRRKTSK